MRGRLFHPRESHAQDVVALTACHKVILELEPAYRGVNEGCNPIIRHRYDPVLYAEGTGELLCHRRERCTGPQPLRAQDVCREVLIPEQEPRLLTIAGNRVERVPRVA